MEIYLPKISALSESNATVAENLACREFRGVRTISPEGKQLIDRIFDEIQFHLVSKLIDDKTRFSNDLSLSRQRLKSKIQHLATNLE